MDHDLYTWSPLPARPALHWPDGARVALCVIVNVEHYDFEVPSGAYTAPSMPGGRGRGPFPDVAIYSLREYGNRVGLFRVIKVLEKHGVPATVAIDAASAANYPFIVQACARPGWEFAGHGHSATQMITSKMSDDEERHHVRSALEAIRASTGGPIAGWFGPEYGESHRTPEILADAGIEYLFDWPNDEQPYRMTAAGGRLVSIPTLVELDDVYAHWHRHVTMWRWQRMVEEAFETLHSDGARSGRLLTLSIHPWLIGQPHRIRCLDDALSHICSHDGVWTATGGQIADHFRRQ